jgi:hypothetical protein
MPAKKKTNYVSYEIGRLDKYIKQLTSFLDKNPPDKAEDRIEVVDGPRGPIIKVIAKKEDQIKLFMDMLTKLPSVLEDVNRLRKSVDGEDVKDIRGGYKTPGFMTSSKENVEEYKHQEEVEIPDGDFDDEEDNNAAHLLLGTDEEIKNEKETDQEDQEEIEDEDPEWDEED